MKALLTYLYPATLLHFLGVVGYSVLMILDLAQPIERWWAQRGRAQPVMYVVVYLMVVLLLWLLAVRQRWGTEVRWVAEVGARRGLRLGGIPVLDLALLAMCLLLLLGTLRYAEGAARDMIYLVGPLMAGVLLCLISGQPRQLDDIITTPVRLREYAARVGVDYDMLARENGFESHEDPLLTFGQVVRLPLQ